MWYGAGDWNRTSDLRFTKPLLCQLSYAGVLRTVCRGNRVAILLRGRKTCQSAEELRNTLLAKYRVLAEMLEHDPGLHFLPLRRQVAVVLEPFVLKPLLWRNDERDAVFLGHTPHDVIILFEPDDERRPPVGLRQRLWPFLQMIERAQSADEPVVWGA